ncbi:response regulator [Anaerocolumna chitinilytica]|uniref:Stage 0 sporulation protein A homolog n=1 Tax=Anaerocolumna chitinilytica TaxID=1727145 RepID=A0A7I8DIJ0_9FIRM|nr:response regulator [Anaerocolumna chitinilytica]BCJ97537.1 response regulator [Anaerocolumna chitinilytica]
MRILIAEDDLVSRKFLYKFMGRYGDCDLVVDGLEAVEAFLMAVREDRPYDLICLDIMMPKLDGVKTLKSIRELEAQKKLEPEKRAKIIMTTALADAGIVQNAMNTGCDAYAAKPLDIHKMAKVLEEFGFTSVS